ncbi:ABC transporter substrate-binding protein [Microvirga sp. 3-52]|jgi:putative ABC transport system substrate-binding protein|uniref:ABC transporter substrate-binding protein n=1 Tax=Microvirga sp. 3-52 TaxID=2792425 RepID=UPI001AC8674D|nr:ABC transporter substrate-binding protein [Microvirga sp. 3-52]MBO1906806.1 ABC transporter substrate-binding protein [Microvirga sp. 3-52]MBS7453995.1 ABC transporter substrate-binding protein [Microvirga sp. 3-52]
MRRRDLLLSALAVPLLPTPLLAQTPEKVWRVGLLTPNQAPARLFRQLNLPELARLGFVEGRNLSVQVFSADDAYERLPALAVDLVATKPDVIVAVAPTAIKAARAATSTIPIVMAYAGENPVAAGWAQSYTRPGGNITGVVLLNPELEGKRLHLLHETFPTRRRIAVLFHSRSRNTPTDQAVQTVAQKAGIEIQSFYTSGPEEYEATFHAIRSSGADALQIAGGPIFANDAPRLAELALKAGVPTICEWRDMARNGCLIGYGPDRAALQRRVADFVARLLRGASASEMPIEDPTKFELAVNLRTARSLAIDVPTTLLVQADEVIE